MTTSSALNSLSFGLPITCSLDLDLSNSQLLPVLTSNDEHGLAVHRLLILEIRNPHDHLVFARLHFRADLLQFLDRALGVRGCGAVELELDFAIAAAEQFLDAAEAG